MYNFNTPKFWDKLISEKKSEIIKSPIYLHKNRIIYEVLKESMGRLLNIGIGYGYLEKFLQDRQVNTSFYGIDFSPIAIKKAKLKVKGVFKVSDVTKIPFQDNYFDFILILDVLEHLPSYKRKQALVEVQRVIKPNGLLIVSVPLNEGAQDSKKNAHLQVYTTETLRKELLNARFFIFKREYLSAFRKMYGLKVILNKIFGFRKPNLLIAFAKSIKK